MTQGHLHIKIKIMVFSEMAWPIQLKLYVKPPLEMVFKFCSRYLGHMTIELSLSMGKGTSWSQNSKFSFLHKTVVKYHEFKF